MENKRIARLAREGFLREPLFQGFSDIRRHPFIRLQAILMSLFAMPLCGLASLLSNDREARTERYKRLFGCQRKMVASDSTLARVLRWLDPQQVKAFLLSFLAQLCHQAPLFPCATRTDTGFMVPTPFASPRAVWGWGSS